MTKFLKATFLQFSGIVGAGVFALPYIFYHSNFKFSFIVLVVVAFLMLLLNSFYISIITRTSGDHQLSGYASIYLGPVAKVLTLLSLSFLCFGGLLAYTKLASTFLTSAFPKFSLFGSSLLFISLVGLFHVNKLNSCKSIFQLLPIVSLLIITASLFTSFHFPEIDLNSNPAQIAYFGSIIFALSGFTILPEVEEALRYSKNKKPLLYLSSMFGLVLSIIVYLLFSYSVIRVSGGEVTTDAVIGVFNKYPTLGYLLIFFGLTTVFKSSLNFIFILKEILFRDLHLSQNKSYLFSTIIPYLVLLFINLAFIDIISLVGAVSTCFSALIICLIFSKISKSFWVNLLSILIIIAFSVGLILSYT